MTNDNYDDEQCVCVMCVAHIADRTSSLSMLGVALSHAWCKCLVCEVVSVEKLSGHLGHSMENAFVVVLHNRRLSGMLGPKPNLVSCVSECE